MLGFSAIGQSGLGQSPDSAGYKLLIATRGSYALTGRAATFNSTRVFAAAVGHYTLTGFTSLLARVFIASAGSYAVTGIAAQLRHYVASISKTKRRVSDFVLQRVRSINSTLYK